jgi:hypothetical protein
MRAALSRVNLILALNRNGVHSASWVQLGSYLEEKVAAPVYKTVNTDVGIRHADHVAPSICKIRL